MFSALPALSTLRNLSKANSFTAPKTEQEDPRCPNFQIFQNFRNFGDFFFGLKSSNFSLLSSDRARIRRVLDDTEKIAQKFDTMSSNEPPQVGHFLKGKSMKIIEYHSKSLGYSLLIGLNLPVSKSLQKGG